MLRKLRLKQKGGFLIKKVCIAKDLEINNKLKELEAEKIYELELLQEEVRFRKLRNRFLGKPNKIEEEIELKTNTQKKIVRRSKRLGI